MHKYLIILLLLVCNIANADEHDWSGVYKAIAVPKHTLDKTVDYCKDTNTKAYTAFAIIKAPNQGRFGINQDWLIVDPNSDLSNDYLDQHSGQDVSVGNTQAYNKPTVKFTYTVGIEYYPHSVEVKLQYKKRIQLYFDDKGILKGFLDFYIDAPGHTVCGGTYDLILLN